MSAPLPFVFDAAPAAAPAGKVDVAVSLGNAVEFGARLEQAMLAAATASAPQQPGTSVTSVTRVDPAFDAADLVQQMAAALEAPPTPVKQPDAPLPTTLPALATPSADSIASGPAIIARSPTVMAAAVEVNGADRAVMAQVLSFPATDNAVPRSATVTSDTTEPVSPTVLRPEGRAMPEERPVNPDDDVVARGFRSLHGRRRTDHEATPASRLSRDAELAAATEPAAQVDAVAARSTSNAVPNELLALMQTVSGEETPSPEVTALIAAALAAGTANPAQAASAPVQASAKLDHAVMHSHAAGGPTSSEERGRTATPASIRAPSAVIASSTPARRDVTPSEITPRSMSAEPSAAESRSLDTAVSSTVSAHTAETGAVAESRVAQLAVTAPTTLAAGMRVLELHAQSARRQVIANGSRRVATSEGPRTAAAASGALAATTAMPAVAADAIEQLRRPVPIRSGLGVPTEREPSSDAREARLVPAGGERKTDEQTSGDCGDGRPLLSLHASAAAAAENAPTPVRAPHDGGMPRLVSPPTSRGAAAPLAAPAAATPADANELTKMKFGTERISVRLSDDAASPIVRISIRGDTVDARISTPDGEQARELGARSRELASALEAKGFDQARVQVRGTGSANELAGPAQVAGVRVAEARDAHESRTDDQRRSPDERPQAWRDERPDPRRQGRQPRRFHLDDDEQP